MIYKTKDISPPESHTRRANRPQNGGLINKGNSSCRDIVRKWLWLLQPCYRRANIQHGNTIKKCHHLRKEEGSWTGSLAPLDSVYLGLDGVYAVPQRPLCDLVEDQRGENNHRQAGTRKRNIDQVTIQSSLPIELSAWASFRRTTLSVAAK